MPNKVRSVSRVRRVAHAHPLRRENRDSSPPHDESELSDEILRARLSGFEEVPPVLTQGTGMFRARVAPDGQSIDFELTFSNLSSPSTAAHLHIGQPGVNGPIFVFLCGGPDQQPCPGTGGRVTGTITADDILSVPEHGLAADDIEGALRLIREGVVYTNVHTTMFPAGEIRGQVHSSRA